MTAFRRSSFLQAERLNGITQQQFVINDPTCFPGLDDPLTTPVTNWSGRYHAIASTIYQISPSLHAPYTLQSAISVERQLTKAATLTVNYLNSRGFDQFLTLNATRHIPGRPAIPLRATRSANLYRYVSEAISGRTSSS